MDPYQADRSVLDALGLWITGLRPRWRELDWAAAAERPELAGDPVQPRRQSPQPTGRV